MHSFVVLESFIGTCNEDYEILIIFEISWGHVSLENLNV